LLRNEAQRTNIEILKVLIIFFFTCPHCLYKLFSSNS
jgi:hypothetical protein